MRIVLLDAATLGADLSFGGLRALGEVTVYPNTAPGEVVDHLGDAEVAVLNKVKLTREILTAAKSLRLICETATGFDNIDIAAAREYGIAVCNVPGYSTPSVVQLTLAMALSLATNLSDFSAQHTDEKGKELVSKTVYGWYEKTSKGVYSIVKIGWEYYSKGEHAAYYDATFILLDENGAMVISPEDLVALIGENRHIRKYSEYGEAFILPMV